MRMLKSRSGAYLGQEALTTQRRRELGVQHLDGDVAVVLEVVRQGDGRHAAPAELALDTVGIRDRRGELLDGCAHCRVFLPQARRASSAQLTTPKMSACSRAGRTTTNVCPSGDRS